MELLFENWKIKVQKDPSPQQYDNGVWKLSLRGGLPEDWSWQALLAQGDKLDIIDLSLGENGAEAMLTAKHLSLFGPYTVQIRGSQGDKVRHTDRVRIYVPRSLSGDANWPEIPTEFSQLEARVAAAAAHPPIPGEGNCWQLWNPEQMAYVQSEIPVPAARDGAAGAKGDTGPQGETGAAGTDGKSAYQLYVDGGGTLTQAQWLASLAATPPKYAATEADMTDTSQCYIGANGHLWAYIKATVEQEVTETISPTTDNPYYDGYRFGSSIASDSMEHDAAGYHLTPIIDLTKAAYQGKTIQIKLSGAQYASTGAYAVWIQSRTYGMDKTPLENRPYTCDTNLSGAGLADTKNGTISVTYESATSAIITVTVPPTLGAAKTKIGYLRFCGKGAVADSQITVTYTTPVTGYQWADTGISYGGGGEAQVSAKAAALNNEGADPAVYNLLPPAVLTYYNSAAYSDSDYSGTNIVRATLPYRGDQPRPVTLKWQHNEDAMGTTVSLNTSPTVLSTGVRQYDATGLDRLGIYNLLPGTKYYYAVIHVLPDGSVVTAKTGSFTTGAQPWRLLRVEGIQNVRDLGGWTGLDGKKVKYGMLFRGSAMDDGTFRDLLLTGSGRNEMASNLGIRAELDLRWNYTESSISPDTDYLCISVSQYAEAITDAERRAQFKTCFEWIMGRLTESPAKPVYFHCQGGCDRTGAMAFLLLGLLGVSESDLARDYELSSFSPIGMYDRTRNSTVYGYKAMVEALKAYSGDTITEKFVDFAVTGCGIGAETINSFRTLMLEG